MFDVCVVSGWKQNSANDRRLMTSSQLYDSHAEASPPSQTLQITAFVLAPILVALLILAAVVAVTLRTRRGLVCSISPRLPETSWPVSPPLKHNTGVCSYFSIGDDVIVASAEIGMVVDGVPKPLVSGRPEETTSGFLQLLTIDEALQPKYRCRSCYCQNSDFNLNLFANSTPENSHLRERSLLMRDDQIKTGHCSRQQLLPHSGGFCKQNIDDQCEVNSTTLTGAALTYQKYSENDRTRHEQDVDSSLQGVSIETTHDSLARTTV